MNLIYGTGNPAKLSAMKRRLKELQLDITGLNEFSRELPPVPEEGATPLENAVQKAVSYYRIFHMPVFSCDSGLYLEGVSESDQPGVHVRTINGTYLSDEEMQNYYIGLVEKYGDLKAYYQNAICLVMDEAHIYKSMDTSLRSEVFLLTSKPYPVMKKGFPLDSLSIDLHTGKYYYELDSKELDRVAVEDGFLEFFRKYCREQGKVIDK